MYTVLFVCTGNTCRSIMAQTIAQDRIEKKGLSKKVRVISAGTSIVPDSTASECAVHVMERKGLTFKEHAAKQLTRELIQEADLILTMTRRHKQYILSLVPEAQKKAFTLKEYVQTLDAHIDLEDELYELAAALEKKELDFFEKNQAELDALKKEHKELKHRMQEIEKKIQEWHIRFHNETKKERETLKMLEEQLLDVDVSDPIGQPIEGYIECAEVISESLEPIIEKIEKDL